MGVNVKIIKNANVVLENGIIWDGGILIEDGKIVKADFIGNIEIPSDAEVIDAKGAYVGPGFVDIHVHGAMKDRLFANPVEIGEHFLKHGETSICPTSSNSFTYEQLMDGIRNVKAHMGKVKNIKGIYMEGPYINPNYGAARHILDSWNRGPIDEKQYKPLVDELGTLVKVWGIAPEREDLVPFLEYARKVNPDVVFSLCHCETTPEQVRALGTKLRPTLITHMFNATGRQTGSGGIRGYGPDEYCMADNEMYAELICDSFGVHVHSDLQRMAIKTKGIERIVLITDSTPYRDNAPKNNQILNADDLNFNEVGSLAGSKLTMDKACRNIMKHTNCGIAQAFVMASLNPAKVIGMDEQIGSIEPGKIADLVFVDDKFNVQQVMLNGDICNF